VAEVDTGFQHFTHGDSHVGLQRLVLESGSNRDVVVETPATHLSQALLHTCRNTFKQPVRDLLVGSTTRRTQPSQSIIASHDT
ncbi:MAG: hypothetical protein ABI781_20140, partial [Burkholderiales bacterium]